MRAILLCLLLLGIFSTAHAADRVVKVLPLLVDLQGRVATSPSLFDRDAYQAYLRQHTNEISAIRYDVLWSAKKSADEKFKLRIELRAVGEGGAPKFQNLETDLSPGTFRKWTSLTLAGDDLKNLGEVVAWRATLWNGGQMLSEQKSFLW